MRDSRRRALPLVPIADVARDVTPRGETLVPIPVHPCHTRGGCEGGIQCETRHRLSLMKLKMETLYPFVRHCVVTTDQM